MRVNLILNEIKIANVKYRQKLKKTLKEGIYEIQGQYFIFKSRGISVNVNKPQTNLQIKINNMVTVIFILINIITILMPILFVLNLKIMESSNIATLFIGIGLISTMINILNWLLLVLNVIGMIEV
ncbi:hypothetical protein EII29_01885 [Leptotrichia sp. OH3620_COT-345]|uniref:hypothetical protein n=1 Tax=Leptotrichia sp. OH3620_COT-345 TaxID=2491048 RepID=UPI000F6504BA|nr:hypothetical protein [Leptotrichia sp. OH3620_COT-345]RRD40707.1 hypothetical protein EII29_01885 [Leptotrichia sp. OH3620_COT-345]